MPTCKHGERKFKTGTGAKGQWSAMFCPSAKGTPDQCPPLFQNKNGTYDEPKGPRTGSVNIGLPPANPAQEQSFKNIEAYLRNIDATLTLLLNYEKVKAASNRYSVNAGPHFPNTGGSLSGGPISTMANVQPLGPVSVEAEFSGGYNSGYEDMTKDSVPF